MGLLKNNWLFGYESKGVPKMDNPPEPPIKTESRRGNQITSQWYPVATHSFNGEKTPGELGNPINVLPDYVGLRLRAYEADLKQDVIKMITGKFFKWVVGSGLKLQSEPNETVLKLEGIEQDFVAFRAAAEARFSVYANSKKSDYSNMYNLHKQARNAFKTKFLGGDCLVILRLINGIIKIQVIDGEEISTPLFSDNFQKEAEARGNRIINGVEVNKKGEHIAFYVVKQNEDFSLEHDRVLAKGEKSGKTMAWMMYGDKHRVNHVRGIPNISAILEKADKMDRYTEAIVGAAEERAKIAYAIEHNRYSTGENPMLANIKKTVGAVNEDDPFLLGEKLSKNITATTSKQTFNMPVGAKLATIASDIESQYESFFQAVFMQLCSAADIPPEVALQKYSSNYSASRAAINGWGFIIDIYRNDFADEFYKPIYNFWLEVEIFKGKIEAPQYIKAVSKKDFMVLESFLACKFTGLNMPHIDPLKEVKAFREMLGDRGKGQVPLISHEAATEALNQGDWAQNYKKFKEEDSTVEELKPINKTEDGTKSKNTDDNK